jgi:thiamine biosynthesis lipoprotein
MMGTYVTIHARGPEESAVAALNAALDRMEEVDDKFNILNPESPLHAFNHNGIPVTDTEILGIVGPALEMSRSTDGAFDVSISPLIELWGFYDEAPELPERQEVEECLERVGYEYLTLEEGSLTKTREDVRIDLGGIAKGYAVGEGVRVLEEMGVTEALIDAGGDIYALGVRDGGPWKVGIRATRGEGLLGYLEVEDTAVMGSGDYERFFIHEGKRYHHIFDPRTGYPAEELSGITVISPDPTMADAWATALFVMGPQRGLQFAEQLADLEVIMVTVSGEVLHTSGMGTELKSPPGDH